MFDERSDFVDYVGVVVGTSIDRTEEIETKENVGEKNMKRRKIDRDG